MTRYEKLVRLQQKQVSNVSYLFSASAIPIIQTTNPSIYIQHLQQLQSITLAPSKTPAKKTPAKKAVVEASPSANGAERRSTRSSARTPAK